MLLEREEMDVLDEFLESSLQLSLWRFRIHINFQLESMTIQYVCPLP